MDRDYFFPEALAFFLSLGSRPFLPNSLPFSYVMDQDPFCPRHFHFCQMKFILGPFLPHFFTQSLLGSATREESKIKERNFYLLNLATVKIEIVYSGFIVRHLQDLSFEESSRSLIKYLPRNVH